MVTTARLGRGYHVGALLGRGGMADVRDGWDSTLHRQVAIKLLHAQYATRPDVRRRFHAEATMVASLNHPNVVTVYDSGEHDGAPYIVMERLPGDSLADRAAREAIPQEQVWSILDCVLAGLDATHAGGVLHRDVTPGNVLRATGGGYKVGDFGLAKSGVPSHTVVGQVFGTFGYLSPQRLAGATATLADDLYAVGVIGYELLAGRHPFGTERDVGRLLTAIMTWPTPPLRTLRPDVDPRLAAVVERAMARDPRRRFASAREMRAALHGRWPVSAPAVPTPARPAKGRWTVAALIAAAVLGVLGATGVALDAASPAPRMGVTLPVPPDSAPAVTEPGRGKSQVG